MHLICDPAMGTDVNTAAMGLAPIISKRKPLWSLSSAIATTTASGCDGNTCSTFGESTHTQTSKYVGNVLAEAGGKA